MAKSSQPDKVEIVIPLPPPATHPNSSAARGHWSVKAKAAKKQRSDACWATLLAIDEAEMGGRPSWPAATIQATFHKPEARAKRSDRDGLNAWLKATIDGIVDAGLLDDDRGVQLQPAIELLGEQSDGERKVVLVVTRLDG